MEFPGEYYSYSFGSNAIRMAMDLRTRGEMPSRTWLHHEVPNWIPANALFFVTVCAATRAGQPLTQNPQTAESIIKSFRAYHQRKIWWGELVVVMPDHVHAIIQPLSKSLTESVKYWKRYLSRSRHIKWQKGWFDHRLRASESYSQKYTYVIENPVRAGLVEYPSQWPYRWQPDR